MCDTCASLDTVTVDLGSTSEWGYPNFTPITTMAEVSHHIENNTYDYTVDYVVPMPSYTLRPTSVAELRVMEQLVALSNSREAMADRDQSVWPNRMVETLDAMREFVGDNVLPFLPPEPTE